MSTPSCSSVFILSKHKTSDTLFKPRLKHIRFFTTCVVTSSETLYVHYTTVWGLSDSPARSRAPGPGPAWALRPFRFQSHVSGPKALGPTPQPRLGLRADRPKSSATYMNKLPDHCCRAGSFVAKPFHFLSHGRSGGCVL